MHIYTYLGKIFHSKFFQPYLSIYLFIFKDTGLSYNLQERITTPASATSMQSLAFFPYM